ncbi:RagB/SusD family nutrient uptake outer membrane protein [Mucilaginibacter sp. SP1R1]|uniref:RagB/SusD family nutrient uptake outer membrane protein n=1 Tax=Mucilaginibacter sp. SP1R1 TaxID=2723091 RepID=UPI001807A2CB|nr:RagB/SusD family nutrient uptake outer membrane protein [Mucilaginibacter sp. SP1R1]MBB6152396.1 hypothetical protein [Mucilaginibacter sp. SP1R1]
MNTFFKYQWLVLLVVLEGAACKKQLDIKPASTLQVPVTAADFQAVMDDTNIFSQVWPYAPTAGADEGFVTEATWSAAAITSRNAYIWDRNVFNDLPRNDWSLSYTTVFYANVVLEGTTRYGQPTAEWQNIRGQASFFRAYAYYQLAQEFCRPYDEQASKTDPGIVLRAGSDLHAASSRSTVAQTYQQIIRDLSLAVRLLPAAVLTKTRPGKAAAYAMLARTCLVMAQYDRAALYADSSLQLNAGLTDYNQVVAAAGPPFKRFNPEVVFHTIMVPVAMLLPGKYMVDTALYGSYEGNDLRRTLFFKAVKGTSYVSFNGSYDGTASLFNGLATDEMYLVRAEGNARTGHMPEALSDLNLLRKNRYQAATYVPLASADAGQVLGWILAERRKELLLRGLRWSDLRRLNKEPAEARTLVKVVGAQRYELPPGDPRYVWPIPQEVIANTGIAQN